MRIPRPLVGIFIVAATLTTGLDQAHSIVGPTNAFGSYAGTGDAVGVRLGDTSVQEYSLYPGFMGWNASQIDFFRGMMYTAVETRFEPSDLTVSLASDNTIQDVMFVPVPVYEADPSVIAKAACRTDIAWISGSHHHRICDKKQVTIFQPFWTIGLTGDQQVYNVLSHEFGHSVGLRHTPAPCISLELYCIGVGAAGEAQWNSSTPPGTYSLMYSNPSGSISLTLHDYANLNLHY